MDPALIQLENVSVALEGRIILRNIQWQLRSDEHWAILGPNGSGKSTFLKLVRGELWPAPGHGTRLYQFDSERQTSAVGIREIIGLVSPELQQRYLRQEWALTALQVIHSGFGNTDYVPRPPTLAQRKTAQAIIERLRVGELLRRNVQELSSGELRKILIARALVGRPRVLVCDELCDGLDAEARRQLLALLDQTARAGTQVLYSSHRREELIPALTHLLVLNQGRIEHCGSVARGPDPVGQSSGLPVGGTSGSANTALPRAGDSRPWSSLQPSSRRSAAPSRRETLLSIEGANVFLGRRRVLRDIDWRIESDQHWAVLGRNGAGKSTLLKLAFGDVHPAHGGQVSRFRFTTRNTIWELKRRVGYISPSFQTHYREPITGAQAVASGFFSSVGLMDRVSRRQQRRVAALLDRFQLGGLADKSMLEMSYGEARRILLLRALVRDPRLLICDEPFDGLDEPGRREFAQALENVAAARTRLVFVTHHATDLPSCLTHGLVLEKGRIVCQGELKDVRKHPATRALLETKPDMTQSGRRLERKLPGTLR